MTPLKTKILESANSFGAWSNEDIAKYLKTSVSDTNHAISELYKSGLILWSADSKRMYRTGKGNDVLSAPSPEFYVERLMMTIGERKTKRIWLSREDSTRPSAGHIDVYVDDREININFSYGETNRSADEVLRFSRLLAYAAGMIDGRV